MTDALQQRPVLVVDFGAQYAQLIARRVREASVYSEIVPHDMPAEEVLAKNPAALILSGGPSSVYAEGAPSLDPGLLSAGVPVLGICYGFQAMASALGGTVDKTGLREYGETKARISDTDSTLFDGQPEEQPVWMSHGDSVSEAPDGMRVTATTPGAAVAAFEDDEARRYGVQWHPEVLHSSFGQRVLENFLLRGAGLEPTWTSENVVEDLVASIREQVGDAHVLCGLSGGVDSSVAAALVQRAVGDQLTCVFVDHGLLRQGEAEQVEQDFVAATGVNLVVVDAKERFLGALAGVTDPEEKRKIIGREFIRVFEQAARDIVADAGDHGEEVRFLVQGTLYPDVVESGGGEGAANIKSHHNVGGLPEDVKFELVEPLRELFKDEVRRVGEELGMAPRFVHRHPFPGPGLAVRILGAVNPERLAVLREADAIALEEIEKEGLTEGLWQAFVVLLPIRTVGVMGDDRTYENVAALRLVTSTDGMTADWARAPYGLLERISARIVNEVRGVNRVVYDITSKPPGTIEWE